MTPYKLFYPEKRQFFLENAVKRSIGESGSYLGVMGIDKRFGNPNLQTATESTQGSVLQPYRAMLLCNQLFARTSKLHLDK